MLKEVTADRLGSALLLVGGVYSVARSFLGREFFFTGIGGRQSGKPVPNWVARPLVFLIGVAAIFFAAQVWRKA
jgi:hypothetical protein